jgi:hypothetical protein
MQKQPHGTMQETLVGKAAGASVLVMYTKYIRSCGQQGHSACIPWHHCTQLHT